MRTLWVVLIVIACILQFGGGSLPPEGLSGLVIVFIAFGIVMAFVGVRRFHRWHRAFHARMARGEWRS